MVHVFHIHVSCCNEIINTSGLPTWGCRVQRVKQLTKLVDTIPARYVLHDELVSALDNAIVLELQTSQKCYQGRVI